MFCTIYIFEGQLAYILTKRLNNNKFENTYSPVEGGVVNYFRKLSMFICRYTHKELNNNNFNKMIFKLGMKKLIHLLESSEFF